jgi:hypothetical protein
VGENLRDAVQEVYESDNFQRSLPRPKQVEAQPNPGKKRRELTDAEAREILRRRRERKEKRLSSSSVGSAFGSVANVLLWTLMIAIAVFLGVYLAREFFGFDFGEGDGEGLGDGAEGGGRRDRGVVERPLGDAQALAAAGQYQEAIHALLLRTLMELSVKRPQSLDPSLTSREVLAALMLGPEEHAALSGLIGAVEHTHFGGETPSLADYQRCEEHFQTFAAAYLRGAA